jgi:DNA-binding response OmpR family regulator
MPGLNGGAVVAQMREKFKGKVPPVILVSGRPEVQELAAQVGAEAFLYKPFDVDELLTLVSQLTGQEARHS